MGSMALDYLGEAAALRILETVLDRGFGISSREENIKVAVDEAIRMCIDADRAIREYGGALNGPDAENSDKPPVFPPDAPKPHELEKMAAEYFDKQKGLKKMPELVTDVLWYRHRPY